MTHFRYVLRSLLLCGSLLLLTNIAAHAGSAAWDLDPASSDWNTAANWTPNKVPNGTAATAIFGTSNITGVSVSKATLVESIAFLAGASAYTIAADDQLQLTVAGISNDSGETQTFVINNKGGIRFLNSASAGVSTGYTNSGATTLGAIAGATEFRDSATAADSTIFNSPGAGPSLSSLVISGHATAGNAVIINSGGVSSEQPFSGITVLTKSASAGASQITNNGGAILNAYAGSTLFFDKTSAGSATITSDGGQVSGAKSGQVQFFDKADANTATLIANGGLGGGDGGLLQFFDDSTGGTARVEVFGNGSLDLSSHGAPGLTIGSIVGDGVVSLGANTLIVGANGLSTAFDGVIQNSGTGGSLTKIGSGQLTLSGASTYAGLTTISVGSLAVINPSGSATGAGAVQVSGGSLGGSGIIAGAVTVGTGSGTGASLAPASGTQRPASLTIQGALTFQSDATYTYTYKAKNGSARADEVTADGVTINSGAIFSFQGTVRGQLPAGTVFTALNNTAPTPIAGSFSNLADGAVLTVDGNNFQASYEGGDGNDLTLTVVP